MCSSKSSGSAVFLVRRAMRVYGLLDQTGTTPRRSGAIPIVAAERRFTAHCHAPRGGPWGLVPVLPSSLQSLRSLRSSVQAGGPIAGAATHHPTDLSAG